MCGIFFCLCISNNTCGIDTNETSHLKTNVDHGKDLLNDSFLGNRGPDVSKDHRLSFSSPNLEAWMRGCVLRLRGSLTPQPLVDEKGNSLLWNGEIFDGIEVTRNQNDTQVLFNRLTGCDKNEDVLKTLEQVQGPWAFIFWQAEKKILWFGRDIFGRRSLLWHLPTDSSEFLVLSSVAAGDLNYTEIPSVGIFALDLSNVDSANTEHALQASTLPSITLYPWYICRWPGYSLKVLESEEHELYSYLTPNQSPSLIPIVINQDHILKHWIPDVNKSISDGSSADKDHSPHDDDRNFTKYLENILKENKYLRSLSEDLMTNLLEAVNKRVNNLPDDHEASNDLGTTQARVAILFSGGLDSSVIAALLDKCLPPDEPIDLLNVAFEQPLPPPKPKQKPKKQKRNKSKLYQAASPTGLQMEFDCADTNSILQENTSLHDKDMNPSSTSRDSNECSVYSSQIACTHRLTDPSHSTSSLSDCVDSMNSKCKIEESTAKVHDPYNVPDRETGRIALSELNPRRTWNFIEINVPQVELQSARSSCVRRLIYPLQTVLDDSIGCAVWFAAKGKGNLANDKGQPVVSTAKVILCGMAADEQFAGYSRHRAHFNKFGEESLVNQLEQEIWRISVRNLGRDDRVIAHHGKEARFPFLDETFTQFVSKIPVHQRANLHLPRGLGEKLLLRLSAWSLGLRLTACQPKRAIQFGSKIAKLDDNKEKGSDICQRLL